MKKFALAAVAAAALSAGVAQAYTVGTFSDGVVVPNVIHNGPTDTTAVGLINQTATVIPVFWTFFDQNSNHVTDGCFPMTPKDYEPFVWSSASGLGLEGKRGYLVFAVGLTPAGISVANACQAANSAAINGAGLIAANAFQVDATNKDVAFIPVIDGPLGIIGDLSTMGPNSLFIALGARSFGAGPAAILTSIGPVSTVLLASTLLDEPITTGQILGGVLVLVGVTLVTTTPAQGQSPPQVRNKSSL